MDLSQVEIFVSILVTVSPLLLVIYKIIAAHLPQNARVAVEQDVTMVVKAVEQVYGSVPGMSGEAKKAFALTKLAQLGVKDSPLVDALLEAAVHALNQSAPVSAAAPVVFSASSMSTPNMAVSVPSVPVETPIFPPVSGI